MSDNSFSWRDILDRFVFLRYPGLWREAPPIESKDGEEPTTEVLRERARQIDAHPTTTPAAKLLSNKAAAALDKEFWESQE